MNTENFGHEEARFNGESATDPIEPPGSTLAVLLLLAGISPLRRHALPAHPLTTHSGLSKCHF
ncbi:MAG: hypothetical protein CVU22_14275 [Betaproteobacteria bacterium HGW-Betaproteobacteria-16]|nr:MAG: hypothetical protein CVU22_14275 [Betaproteobacteria bacterium HGW-Betaproteobacteria-16]